jgi:hypothetical protein
MRSRICALALLTSHPVALALTCVFGTLNDERWLISAPFIICWHASERAKADIFDWQIAAQATAGIVVGLCCVLLVRRALTVGWIGPGIADPGIYREMWTLVYSRLQPYGSNWWLFILNIAMGFGWYWFAILTAPRRLWSSGAAITAWVMAGTLLIGTAATVFVADVSRSIGFLYLGLVIAAVSAYDSDARAAVRLWRNLLILGCITPTIYYTGYSGAAFVPLPLDAANMFLQSQYGIDVMQMMKSYFRLH